MTLAWPAWVALNACQRSLLLLKDAGWQLGKRGEIFVRHG